ncbi:MAG: SIMPL domain-containing protein [Deltaproteobacteria bacterium]|nr:SIMPL domain-containing protein [Deltaproteobacteria bacterium]
MSAFRSLARVLAFSLVFAAAAAMSAQVLPQPRNQVSFSVFAEREVANDWTTGTIGTTASGSDPAELAARINKQMTEALALAKQAKGVKVTSGSYNTYPEYGDGNRIVRWQASQDLILESKDTDAVAKLLGKLQAKGLLLRGISFSVSRETQRKLEDELIAEAIEKFRSRASLVAKSFGKSSYGLITVNVGGGGFQPPMPYMRADMAMMAKAESAPAPSFEGGTSHVRMDVNGTIELE